MAESGKRHKGRLNSCSQQPLHNRNKRPQSSSIDQHDDGHKRQQPRPRHNTETRSDNQTTPSASAIGTTVDARRHVDACRHIDIKEEDHSGSRQTVSIVVDIKQEKDEPKVITESAAHDMVRKQTHAGKPLKFEVNEDEIGEQQRIKMEPCDDQNNKQDADDKPSSSSKRHQSEHNKTDHTHGHKEKSARRKHCQHHKKSKKDRKSSSSRKQDDTKNKEKAHGNEKSTSDEVHEKEQKTSNCNSATISTNNASEMYVENPFNAVDQNCDSSGNHKSRRYSAKDNKIKNHKGSYKRRHSHSGCFLKNREKDDIKRDLLRWYVENNDDNKRKRRHSSVGSQEAQTSPSGYHLVQKCAKIESIENRNENRMGTPTTLSPFTNEAAENLYMMNYIKRESSEQGEKPETNFFDNDFVAASDTLEENEESADGYMYLHGYGEEDGQACISYCNIDPILTQSINQSPEVFTIGYANELKKFNNDEYDYSSTNAYLEAGNTGCMSSNNTTGSIYASDNNYDYDNKQKYTQEYDKGGGYQFSSEPSPYKDKTELIENSVENMQNSSKHHHHRHDYAKEMLKKKIWKNMYSSEIYRSIVANDNQPLPEQTFVLDIDTVLTNNDVKEDLNSAMTKDADADLSTSGNFSNWQRSPDWPKPSPNLSEFLRRMNKPISPRSLESESRSNNIQTPDPNVPISEEGYTRWFYESLGSGLDSKRRSSIATVWEHNRSPDDLSLNEINAYTTPQSAESYSPDLTKKRIECRRSTTGSKQSFGFMKDIQFDDEFSRQRFLLHSDPPTSSNESNANNNEFSPMMSVVTPSEDISKRRRSTNDSEPRSGIGNDHHTEHSYMDENVDTKFDIAFHPSSSSAAIGEGSGVFRTPEVSSHTKKSSKRRRSMAGGGQIGKNRQHLLSAKDDFFKKPFEYGWRRELVWRSNLDSTSKADVYFISPSGKKLRSRTDIAPLLEGDLTIDHFCFIREPQDVDPQYELVRNAKSSRRASTLIPTIESAASSQTPSTLSTIVMGKRVSKPKAPKGASPPPEGWTAVRALRSNNAALTQRISTSANTVGASSVRGSSALQISNNNNSNNTSNSIIKQERSMNVVPQTIITNGLITNTKEKCAVTDIPQPQPQPALINDSISTIQTFKTITIKPPEPTSKQLQGSIAVPVAVAVADNTENISKIKRRQEETYALLSSIDCNKCKGRMKGNLLSDLADPVRRCELCRKRINNILNVKILSREEALANAANIKSSQEIVVVKSKKYISVSRPKEEKPKPIEMSTSMQPRFERLFETLSQLKQKKNSSTSVSFVDAETNTSPVNFSPRVVASDTDTVATATVAANSITANQSTTNDDDTNESITATGANAATNTTTVATAATITTNAIGPDSNSKNVNINNELSIANNYLAHFAKGYEAILCLMKHLMLPERALLAKTCKLFNAVHNDSRVWQSVNLRNTYILDWHKFTSVLQRQNTRVLDMRRIIQKSGHQRSEMWRSFFQHIVSVKSLNTLILPRCSSRIVDSVLECSQELRSLTAFSISDERISLTNLKNLRELRELRLHSSDSSDLIGNFESIPMHLRELTSLSLTNIQNLHNKNIASLLLQRLETLELGDCSNINATDLVTVLQVMQLRRLRLEFGMSRETSNNFSVSTLLNGLHTLENLKQLELINIDIKPGFDKELSKCIYLKKLLIIPTYLLQSATTNQIIMNAVQQMSNTQLVAFTWGFTIELLRVTSLYIDKSKEKRKKYDDIPILRPVPGDIYDKLKYEQNSSDTNSAGEHTNSAEQHVAIVPLKKVEDIVRHALPHTKFSAVKVYFASTWKQQLIE